jgi:hypothetical protein
MFSPVFVDVSYVKSTWILTWHRMDRFHGHLDYFWKSPLGSRPNTKPGYHGTPNIHNHRRILFYCVWKPTWIEIHWNSIRLIARSHVTSHCSWGSVTTLDDFGVLGQPLDTFFGLSQFHRHGSWLVCEVALIVQCLLNRWIKIEGWLLLLVWTWIWSHKASLGFYEDEGNWLKLSLCKDCVR